VPLAVAVLAFSVRSSVYFLTQKLVPLIRDGGRIVNISSGLAGFSQPSLSAYGAAKGAIEVFTRYLAKELGPRGIKPTWSLRERSRRISPAA
jgi:NAD(P)-dependent dehydrogenase (short-subunit alcohol dehydrogenase family)